MEAGYLYPSFQGFILVGVLYSLVFQQRKALLGRLIKNSLFWKVSVTVYGGLGDLPKKAKRYLS